MMNNKGKEKDKHGDSNQEKWFAFPYCGKEVKYVTKLFKGEIAYKISNMIRKILTYKKMGTNNKFNRSDIHLLLGPDCRTKYTAQSGRLFCKSCNEHLHLSNIKIQIQHLQNTYMILDIYLALWNVSWILHIL